MYQKKKNMQKGILIAVFTTRTPRLDRVERYNIDYYNIF